MKNNNKIQYYWDDDYLYLVYKLINIKRFSEKKLIDFEYLRPPKKDNFFVGHNLNDLMRELDIKVDGFVFHKDLYKKYNKEDYKKVKNQIENKKRKEKNSVLEKVFNNKFNYKDFLNIPITQASIYSWFEFNANLPQKSLDKLKKYLNCYLKNYINEKLQIDKENITIFSKQKIFFSNDLIEKAEKYGDSFVLKNDISSVFLYSYFYIHNILAFEYLKLIIINDLYILDYDKNIIKQQEQYNTKIVLKPKYIKEYKEQKEKYFKKPIDKNNKQILETEELLDKLESDINKKAKDKGQKQEIAISKTFEIQVKDRYIWINNYLLSKPHAVGSNLEFFEYICLQPANTKIERKRLPDFGGISLKQEVKNKSFIKILNALGFKGEILKTFFPKRGKDILIYRGNIITEKDLEKSGIKKALFLKELELAHIKNSPE